MKSWRGLVVLLAAGLLVATSACRNRPWGNDNGNDNGNGSELTQQQKNAVDAVVDQLDATVRALASVADSFEGLDADEDTQFVGCPTVTADVLNSVISVTVDFPPGCTNDYFGDDIELSGGVTITMNLAELSLEITFDDFTSDDQTVAGTLDMQLTRDGFRRTLTGNIDIATTGVGSADGTLEIDYDSAQGRITIIEASLALTDTDEVEYSVDAEGLVIQPFDNGNLVPQAGSATFVVPGAGAGDDPVTIVITFTADSPVDGTVTVKVDEFPAVEYDIDG